MFLKQWGDLPENMKNESVKEYYSRLEKKKFSLFSKRIFDIVVAIFTCIIVLPLFIFISIAIKMDSKGPIMFRQVRVTQYGKLFRIYKFRTMVTNADKVGPQVTSMNDKRVTKVGKVLRKLRIDEIPQLFNIILGDMSFVGTRPEVVKYVEKYSEEMMATLLLPAGVTSEASILFKDEETLFDTAEDVEKTYINEVLVKKMKYNLQSLEEFSFFGEIKLMFLTIIAVVRKDNETK